ncbi:hypothetical protein [Desulfobulbus sp.]|uniref:hypothetical protein n=1 Tax=Desulfobulbus sp. TaxID=895 RepID=UPI0027BAAF5C|nr:hypothetical protein [Desulfobulbus sp.]
MRFSLKWCLHLIGGGFGFAGVVFVALRLSSYTEQLDLARFTLTTWAIIVLLALTYGVANIMLARSWWHLLTLLDVQARWRWTIKAYGQSQLAKYVPGNIFHLAGRQALGMAEGLPARPLAKSIAWELGLIAIAGLLFAVLAVPLVWSALSLSVASFLFVTFSVALYSLTRRSFCPQVAFALAWQVTFLGVSSIIFVGALAVIVPQSTVIPAFPALCGVYVIAWIAGLVTPGTPAGVGVRELVLLSLLGNQFAQADLLLAIVLGRVVTVVGDLLYFIVATFLKPRERSYE